MKTCILLFVVLIGGVVTASAQNAGASAANTRPQLLIMADNPQHAAQTPLAPEQDLLGRSENLSAHGERPLWEFMAEPRVVSLGDVAREFRLEHAAARKAVIVWVN